MIDIDTHRIIDMIESRELNEVKAWLSTYPNLEVVSRDGSITYKNAIELAHPNAVQVSDRFHILKKLTTYCKEILYEYFKPKIFIEEQKIDEIHIISKDKTTINKHTTLESKLNKALEQINNGINKSKICENLNLDIRVLNKLLKMSSIELKTYFKTSQEITNIDKLNKKMELVNMVRKLHSENISNIKISEKIGIDRKTVKKYLNPYFAPIHKQTGVKKGSIIDPYLKDINDLYKKGNTSKKISLHIRNKGYKGSDSSIRNYLSKLKKETEKDIRKDKCIEITVKRNVVVKLLYNPIDKIKDLTEDMLTKINTLYPFFEKIIYLVNSLKNIMKNKEINKLSSWIDEALSINNKYLNSFLNGIGRDFEAFKNSIIYEYNNGLAEGSVNKLKVVKRIMYGRNSFELLRKKILQLEKMRQIN